MDLRRLSGADMVGRHHPPLRGDERSLGIGQEGRDPRERLVLLGIENVKDRADQQRMRGFFTLVPPFECALGYTYMCGKFRTSRTPISPPRTLHARKTRRE